MSSTKRKVLAWAVIVLAVAAALASLILTGTLAEFALAIGVIIAFFLVLGSLIWAIGVLCD